MAVTLMFQEENIPEISISVELLVNSSNRALLSNHLLLKICRYTPNINNHLKTKVSLEFAVNTDQS